MELKCAVTAPPWPRRQRLQYSLMSSFASCRRKVWNPWMGKVSQRTSSDCKYSLLQRQGERKIYNTICKFSCSLIYSGSTHAADRHDPLLHILVEYYTLWAGHFQAASISLLPVNGAMTRRLAVGRHHHQHFTVHPSTCWHLSSLDSYWFSSIKWVWFIVS